jgi:hypothetical protein
VGKGVEIVEDVLEMVGKGLEMQTSLDQSNYDKNYSPVKHVSPRLIDYVYIYF